jgi:hypothetical protein
MVNHDAVTGNPGAHIVSIVIFQDEKVGGPAQTYRREGLEDLAVAFPQASVTHLAALTILDVDLTSDPVTQLFQEIDRPVTEDDGVVAV